jgi:hypothetical protein
LGVKNYVAEKKADADKTRRPSSVNGGAPVTQKEIRPKASWESAREAAMARLEAAQNSK